MFCLCGQQLQEINGIYCFEEEDLSRAIPLHRMYRVYANDNTVLFGIGACDPVVKTAIAERDEALHRVDWTIHDSKLKIQRERDAIEAAYRGELESKERIIRRLEAEIRELEKGAAKK